MTAHDLMTPNPSAIVTYSDVLRTLQHRLGQE